MMEASSEHLLVVDDEELNRMILSAMLTRLGYDVTLATSGEDALARIGSEPYDLALLDILMGGRSGLETLEGIRSIRSRLELPVIMVTASHDSIAIVRAFELGANDYVTKPIDLAGLGARVRTQLEILRLSRLKDEFLAMASHDLKNPLCSIGLAAEALEKSLPAGAVMTEKMHSILKTIGRSVKRMTGIVEDFVDGQALQEGRLELLFGSMDLNQVARQASLDQFDLATAKQIELRLELDPHLAPIQADERRAIQLIDNLLGNAIKFSSPGDAVTIRTQAEEAGALLEVSDTGPGLADSDMDHLFVKYARRSNQPTGGEKSNGLGLAICKQLVELHSGQIGARNNLERGATFWVRLPSDLASQGPAAAAP